MNTKWYRKNPYCSKRNFYWMHVNGVVHDGMTEPMHMTMFDILYPLFIISGVGIFMWILLHWNELKSKIKGQG